MSEAEIERKVLEAISRISHRPVASLNPGLSLRRDLGLDSLNALELEYELQQAGMPDMEIENLMAGTTIGDIIRILESAR